MRLKYLELQLWRTPLPLLNLVESYIKSYSWSQNQITVRVSRSARVRFRLIILVSLASNSVLIWF